MEIDNSMLYEYQKKVLENSKLNYLYPLDTGTGKTLIALHHYYMYAKNKRLLVVAPAAKIKEKGWDREIDKFKNYYGVSDINYQTVSYQSLHKINLSDISNTFLILDECHYIKNYKAKRSKEILKITKKVFGFIGLSATIASNGWVDTVNYFLMFAIYKNAREFLKKHAIYEMIDYGKVKVNQIIGWREENILKSIFDKVSAPMLKKEDCLDLPPIVFTDIYLKKSKDYEIIKKDRVHNDIVYDTMPKLISGLRLNGNLKDKIEYLKMIRESNEENIIIFYNFQAEYELIKSEFEKSKIDIDYEVRGGINKLPEYGEFERLHKTVTLVQIQAGGTGIELTYGNLIVLFSPTWSYQDYEQALGRAYRNGQNKKVTVYKFIVEDTIDSDVYKALEHKKDFTEKLFLKKQEGMEMNNTGTEKIIEPGENVTKNRHKYVGGSDLPALLNISNYKTQYELAKEKAGLCPVDFKGNEYTRYGQLLEPLIRDYINSTYGTNFKENTNIDEENHIRSNTDGLDPEQELLLEVKTNNGEKEDLTEYIVQIQLYLYQFGIDSCYLAQYKRPESFYKGTDFDIQNSEEYFDTEFDPENLDISLIEKDENLIKYILDEIRLFWTRVNYLIENPNASEGEYYTCTKIGVYDQKAYLKTMSNIEKLNMKLEKMKEIKEKLEQEKEILYAIMDTFNFKNITTDKFSIVKIPATVNKTFDTKKFQSEHKDLYEQYLKEIEKKGHIRISEIKKENTMKIAEKVSERKVIQKSIEKKTEKETEKKTAKINKNSGWEPLEFERKMDKWIAAKNKKINSVTNERYSVYRPEKSTIRVVQNRNSENCIIDFEFNKEDMSVKLKDDSNFDKTIPVNFEDFNRIIRAMPVWVMLDNIPDENTGNEANSENNEESE